MRNWDLIDKIIVVVGISLCIASLVVGTALSIDRSKARQKLKIENIHVSVTPEPGIAKTWEATLRSAPPYFMCIAFGGDPCVIAYDRDSGRLLVRKSFRYISPTHTDPSQDFSMLFEKGGEFQVVNE